MPKLIRHDTKDEHDLRDGANVIGRSSSSDIQIRARQVSRTHCKIEGPAGGWVVTDCGSTLGTYVNGKRVRQHRLQQHDEIKVGPVLLVFDEDLPPSPARRRLEGEAEREDVPDVRPRRSVLALVPVVLGAVLALGAIGGLLAVVVVTRRTPTRVVRRAAELLRRRDADALWALVSKERKQQITLAEFKDQVGLVPSPVLRALRTLEVGAERRVDVGVVVPVAVEVGGTRIADEVVLYREGGDWKLHRVPVDRVRELTR